MVWVNHFSAFTIYSWLTEKFLKVWKTANHYGIILKEVISCVDDCSSKWEKMQGTGEDNESTPRSRVEKSFSSTWSCHRVWQWHEGGVPSQDNNLVLLQIVIFFFSEQEFGKWYWCQSFLIFLGRCCLTSTGTRLTYISSDMQKVIRKT